mmetsp:Transcript_7668/g.20116  ORF Transcript_7668/g.20116 Transcript_7668/m.20116 type:complete len:232 (-) Transcript_7668:848-1543(-)
MSGDATQVVAPQVARYTFGISPRRRADDVEDGVELLLAASRVPLSGDWLVHLSRRHGIEQRHWIRRLLALQQLGEDAPHAPYVHLKRVVAIVEHDHLRSSVARRRDGLCHLPTQHLLLPRTQVVVTRCAVRAAGCCGSLRWWYGLRPWWLPVVVVVAIVAVFGGGFGSRGGGGGGGDGCRLVVVFILAVKLVQRDGRRERTVREADWFPRRAACAPKVAYFSDSVNHKHVR